MAYCDYIHCAVCDAKAFYDAYIDWDCQNVPVLEGCGDPTGVGVLALCKACAETHELVVRPKESAPADGAGEKT